MHRKTKGTLATSALARAILIGAVDVVTIAASFFFALWMRHDFAYSEIPLVYLESYQQYVLPWCGICVVVFILWGLYSSIWTYASVNEVLRIMGAYVCLGVLAMAGDQVFGIVMPISCYIVGLLLSFCFTVAIRFSYRLARNLRKHLESGGRRQRNVMIIGGGEAGRALITEFESSSFVRDRVVCVIDDNPFKRGRRLCGVPIVGGRDSAVWNWEIPAPPSWPQATAPTGELRPMYTKPQMESSL